MAKQRRDSMIKEANTYDEFLTKAKEPGFIKVNWCGNTSCEDKIKDDTGMKSRCIIDDEEVTGKCVVCGNTAKHRIYFGRQY